MSYIRRFGWPLLFMFLVPVIGSSQESDTKVHDAGLGFAFSSGQSIFYTRATNPFQTNHLYYSLGVHLEQEGIGITYYDYTLGDYATTSKQVYYLELGSGWRRHWFEDNLAGGFFPHTVIEAGLSGYLAQYGSLRKYFRETAFKWDPYIQIGAGISVFTGPAIYRIEMGYLSTLATLPVDVFPRYEGVFLKIVISSGQKPR
ncbi:MAG: hypothetical protein JSW54_03370 [Fidelibacterota bacterium]|nr:MAG: hypothetical protein JSW54_03370 [Candidatus Neomarinimicrobiota bacterium]